MRFAAIADFHGNYLALEAVLADIRARDITDIVNLGDMLSGPLDARRTIEILMKLDAVHVLGNHDRYLLDHPPEKMGSWDRPAHAALNAVQLDWLRAQPMTRVFRHQVFLCHATPGNDEVIGSTRCIRMAPWHCPRSTASSNSRWGSRNR